LIGRRFPGFSAAFLACSLPASAAQAWASVEHQQIGRTSYERACTEVGALAAARAGGDPGLAGRLDIACGRNTGTTAGLYGDATAIAGDFLAEPSEFLSLAGAWRFSSRKHYWLLALENSEHFNPMATRAWADYHQEAVEHALAGSREQGLASIQKLQLAVSESAFADHFLQDSFAAGHMGFNRTASSAAAAKSFHDTWNARGRVVSDRARNRWVTFGDGRLELPTNADSRRHVMDAATLSVREVIRAFVLGERSYQDELAIWNALPFTIEAPELEADLVELAELLTPERPAPERALVALAATVRPARKDLVGRVTFWSAAPFEDPGKATVAGVVGLELAVPLLPVQGYVGAGGTLLEPVSGAHSAVVEAGVLVPLGLSLDGLLSHQLNATASWIFRTDTAVDLQLDYQLTVELGDFLLGLSVGLAELLPHARTGWYGALAVGYVFSSAGGGAF
jgi:hypothetical protein